MLRWWKSDVNFSSFLCLAACRTRSSACVTRTQPCVRCVLCSPTFLLVPALGSTGSAASATDVASALFVGFAAIMAECDFSRSCIIGYGSSPSRRGPVQRHSLGLLVDREISRVPHKKRTIAVGTQVTPRPPRRSVRALLRHTAPTLGADGKAYTRPWMKDLGLREKVIGQLCHPLPRKPILLTASPQRAQPEALDMVAEGAECRVVCRHGMVCKIAPDDLCQPASLFRDRLVHLPS